MTHARTCSAGRDYVPSKYGIHGSQSWHLLQIVSVHTRAQLIKISRILAHDFGRSPR